jgi:protein-S-isoprenylcysteine O-methyltransferase Ste14
MRWRLVGRIWAICGTVSGPSSARLRSKPKAPPPLAERPLTPWLSIVQDDTLVVISGAGHHMTDTDAGTAGVIARPPLIFLAALLLGFMLESLLPLPFPAPWSASANWLLAGALIIIGLALALAGIRNFSVAGTPVPTNEPSRALVTTGIHGHTRNPIYLGMFLLYGGIGVAAHSLWILILLLPLAITMRWGVVAREEVYLERRFGDAYRAYKARVRRWI